MADFSLDIASSSTHPQTSPTTRTSSDIDLKPATWYLLLTTYYLLLTTCASDKAYHLLMQQIAATNKMINESSSRIWLNFDMPNPSLVTFSIPRFFRKVDLSETSPPPVLLFSDKMEEMEDRKKKYFQKQCLVPSQTQTDRFMRSNSFPNLQQ